MGWKVVAGLFAGELLGGSDKCGRMADGRQLTDEQPAVDSLNGRVTTTEWHALKQLACSFITETQHNTTVMCHRHRGSKDESNRAERRRVVGDYL